MSKAKSILIGVGVLVLGLGVLFGIQYYRNRKADEAVMSGANASAGGAGSSGADGSGGAGSSGADGLGGGASSSGADGLGGGAIGDSPMNAPVLEAQTADMPSLIMEETYLARRDWVENPDGSVSYQGDTYKRNAHVKAILCAGVDHKNGMESKEQSGTTGAADGIFLIAQDTSRNTIKVVMIPRDSMLDYTMQMNGKTYTTFNHLTLAFVNGDGRKSSAESLVKATSDLLCGLQINHYLAGDLELLAEVNDMVGGVRVTVPNDELRKRNPAWTKGKEITLHGDEAETFIRYRDIEVDGTPVVRMEQHKAYITGFFRALQEKSRTDSGIVSRIVDRVDASVVTDMSKGEYEKIILDAMQGDFSPEKDITSLTGTAKVGEVLLDGKAYDEVYLDYTQTIPVVLDLFYRKID